MARAAVPAAPMPSWPRPGAWIVASLAMRREVFDQREPYPHIDEARVRSPATGRDIRLRERDCWRCGEDKAQAVSAGG